MILWILVEQKRAKWPEFFYSKPLNSSHDLSLSLTSIAHIHKLYIWRISRLFDQFSKSIKFVNSVSSQFSLHIVCLSDCYFLVQSEVNFLGRLSHPNLVKLLGYCLEDTELLLVYEFMQKGSLENHLFGSKKKSINKF